MQTKQNKDVISLFVNFQKQLLRDKPAAGRMHEEIRMMKFKIRPLRGDVSMLNFKDEGLIEVLWSLGKLDEFFQKKYTTLNKSQQKIFFQLFEDLHNKYQDRLSELNLKAGEEQNLSPIIEMEIFKEGVTRSKVN